MTMDDQVVLPYRLCGKRLFGVSWDWVVEISDRMTQNIMPQCLPPALNG